jgi:hypothetical protein
MTHPRTTAALLAFDALGAAAQALVATLPDAWLMPSSPGRASSTPPLISVGLLVHHTQRAAVVRLEDQHTLFPTDAPGPWASAHQRLVAAHALERLEQAARDTEEALRGFPTLRAGFSFGLIVPQPTTDTIAYAVENRNRPQLQAMGNPLTKSVERRSKDGPSWSAQRERLAALLALLAPFDAEADALWVIVSSDAVAEAQNGWHEGRAALEPGDTQPNDPDPVVGSFDNALGAGGSGHGWRISAQRKQRTNPTPYMPMRLVPAGDADQAAALALTETILFEHLWDVDRWGELAGSVQCARFERL